MNFHGKWWVLAVVQLGVLLCSIDATIVLFALNTIAKDFRLEIDQVQWIMIAYTITAAATLTLAGKLADVIGRKPAYLIGFAVFTIASVICGLAGNLGTLVAMRVFTALGTAFLLSSSSVITTAVFPKEQHGLALGIGATVLSIGVALGFSLGGFILHVASWRWVFLINLPIGIVALIAGALIMDAKVVGLGRKSEHPLDLGGAFLLMVSLTGLLLGVQYASNRGAVIGVALLGASAVSGFLFLQVERRAADPVLPPSLFRIREITVGSISRAIMRMAGAGVTFTLPFYLQRNLGLSPAASGSILLANVAVLAFAGPAAGHIADRWGAGRVTVFGLIVLGLGTAFHLCLPDGAHPANWQIVATVIAGQALMGAGSAMFGSPNASLAIQAAPRGQKGIASGVLWTTTFIGQSLGTALAAILLQTHGGQVAGVLQNQRWVFAILTVLLSFAVLISLQRVRPVAGTVPS